MNEYVYSARHNAFFPVDMIDKYKSEGWDLSDAKEVNQNIMGIREILLLGHPEPR